MPLWLTSAFWAGVISLDFIGFGPIMISQPIVCGPIFGWMLGHVAIGLLVGVIVQFIWMDVTAVGVGIPYDATATTLLAVYWASSPTHASLSQIVLAVILAVPFGLIFRWIDHWARRLNTRIIRGIDGVSDKHLSAALKAGIGLGLLGIFVRYFVCYAAALWLGKWIWTLIAYQPRLTRVDQGLTMAAILLPMAGLGVCLELMLSDEPQSRWGPRRMIKKPPLKGFE